ncbi:MAG: T9SS type A sorting domain-containing protein [Candidatus Latescibacterota bacterium]
MKRIFSLAFAILFAASPLGAQEKYITIGSFCISELGSSRPNKDHRAIAGMIEDFDLTVIQDVQDKGGAEHIRAIVDSLNVSAPAPFSFFIIPRAGRGFPGYEGYAFIYRFPVELDRSHDPAYGLKSTAVEYGRIPGYAFFKAGNFDFLAAVIHLHWSDLDTRKLETADLLAWMKEYADKPSNEERDLLILGNTNRFGNYSAAAIESRQTDFHQLLDDPDLGTKFRLIFCEYLPAMDAREAPTKAGSTTVSAENNMVYEQIMISAGTFAEFGDAKAEVGKNIRIVDFDTSGIFSGLDTATIKDLVSDHRPIYAKFRYDLPDDDGVSAGVQTADAPVPFTLSPPFPNPFNPSTAVTVSVPRETRLMLTVYNIAGQKVATIADERVKAGRISFSWNAQAMPSGIYFFRAQMGNTVEVKKAVMVK